MCRFVQGAESHKTQICRTRSRVEGYSKAMPMVNCELEAADSGFVAVLTVLDFSNQG